MGSVTLASPIIEQYSVQTLRLAVNAAFLGDRPSGLGRFTFQLARALSQAGATPIVYTSTPKTFLRHGISTAPTPQWMRMERGLVGNGARLAWTQSRLVPRALADKAQVILNPLPEGGVNSPIPQVTVVHDMTPLWFPKDYVKQFPYFRFALPTILRGSARIIADSKFTKDDLLSRFKLTEDFVHVIHPGIDAEVFHPDPNKIELGRPSFLYVGNLLPHKNLHRLIEAFSRLIDRLPHQLVIVGQSDARHLPTLMAQVHELGIEERVDFTGYLADRDLTKMYAKATALVFPSLHEGFGLPPLEAMACGTPVIASRATSIPEVVGETALLVDPTDISAWSRAMIRLAENEDLQARLSHQGQARAAGFSWDKTAESVLNVIEASLA